MDSLILSSQKVKKGKFLPDLIGCHLTNIKLFEMDEMLI
jgi:hypothetical protein